MTLKEIADVIRDNYGFIKEGADENGRDPKVYVHWTAGDYDTLYSDYHLCIKGDGSVSQTHDFKSPVESTYMRNSGSVSVALCCASGGVAFVEGYCDLGVYPPTDIQLECVAQIIAVVCRELDIPIDIQHVMTHAEAADNADGLWCHEPYGPTSTFERWDLAVTKESDEWLTGGDILRGKAAFYLQQGI